MRAKDRSMEVVEEYTAGTAAYSFLPIPGGTSLGLATAEAAMIGAIAKVYGLKIDAVVWPLLLKYCLLQLGGSAGLKALAEGLTYIPIIGWFAKSIVGGGSTYLMGRGAISYFEEQFPYQEAYKKPSWEYLLVAFGGAMGHHELKKYWNTL